MATFRGFAPLQTPTDLLGKLQHDFERVRNDPADSYAAFDFFVTAEHMVDWILPDSQSISQSSARKIRRESEEILRITSHLANGAKHFQATSKQHMSVQDIDDNRGGFDSRSFSSNSFSPNSFKIHGLSIQLTDGRVIHVLALAEDVLSYWRSEVAKL
jgi:hypothetical protein